MQTDCMINACVRLANAAGDSQMIVQEEDGSGTGRTWLYSNASSQLASYLGNAETARSDILVIGSWFHIALVTTGSNSHT